MTEPSPYAYAVVRLVPHIIREEFCNVGVIVFSAPLDFLSARFDVSERIAARLHERMSTVDPAVVVRHLEGIYAVCTGQARDSPIARLPRADRFHWLTAARSSMIQSSTQHCGVCRDPEATLDRLFLQLVGR